MEAAYLPARDIPDVRQLAAPRFHKPVDAERDLGRSVVHSSADDVLASFAVRLTDPSPHAGSTPELVELCFGEPNR